MSRIVTGSVLFLASWALFYVLCGPIADLFAIEILRDSIVSSLDSLFCAIYVVAMFAIWTIEAPTKILSVEIVLAEWITRLSQLISRPGKRSVSGIPGGTASELPAAAEQLDPFGELKDVLASLSEKVDWLEQGLGVDRDLTPIRSSGFGLDFAPVR